MIYLITNTVNGKQYVGKTSRTIDKRWYHHKWNARHGRDSYLYRAIRKYGEESFVVESLGEGDSAEEIAAIALYRPAYNMTKGGDGGDMSGSPRWVSSLARRDYRGSKNPMFGKRGEQNPNFGKTRSDEQRANSRAGYVGKRTQVRVDGVDYPSVANASKMLGRSERYIRIHDELNSWTY